MQNMSFSNSTIITLFTLRSKKTRGTVTSWFSLFSYIAVASIFTVSSCADTYHIKSQRGKINKEVSNFMSK